MWERKQSFVFWSRLFSNFLKQLEYMYFNQKKIRGDKEPYEGGEMLVPVPVSQLGECSKLISQMLDNILSPGKQTKL